ncbi:carboxyl transferase domain-containing protein [Bradyrhizobium sp. LHD-71]|uniref:acetyl-CoA carboxylase family protein n=1 Tax=Bradyrhizobium sp. LHD-71 TaxID=3072141 RepID=UPI00280D532B|nr:carboxyl transferase domain-containing protein [Bradyrhizobium sp. LHD-71]MDQ8731833.1 carboxyl transferase domain-containing protein [Bradyrhizobium sp. LHD-71]
MPVTKLLIANRGEIAIRVARAAADMGLPTVAVHSEDDAASLHVRLADAVQVLKGQGAAAYLDGEQVIAAAKAAGCDAIHPGYGFLAERADFAAACAAAGLTFVGPAVKHLDLFGDKARARQAAVAASVPVIRGIDRACTLDDAKSFFASLGPEASMIIKALAGGGGRGTRVVTSADEIEKTFARCASEARAAFGRDELYVEELIPRARHIEVQILGDRTGAVTHLSERECSVQRRFQKLVEIAPAPALDDKLRRAIVDAAVRLAKSVGYFNLGTFEFLVDVSGRKGAQVFAFIEANARLQVEHTVTEAVTGVDLVQAQIRLAQGATLKALGLDRENALAPRGYAIQARVNMETLLPDGAVRPGGGTLTIYEAPNGPGVRTDGFGYAGYRTSSAFDSLLAKVIVHAPSPNFADAVARASRALSEFRLEGVATNIAFLRNVLEHPDFVEGRVHTRWLDEHVAALAAATERRQRFVQPASAASRGAGFAGANVKSKDPLALFAHDAAVKAERMVQAADEADAPDLAGPDGSVGVAAPIQGTIVAIDVAEGDAVRKGQQVAVVEAMKMEHVIAAPHAGIVRSITMAAGDVVREGFPIVFIKEAEVAGDAVAAAAELDLDHVRDDLKENIARHALTLDENRPEAVARRRKTGHKMPRENIDRLVDPGSFNEYWPLIVARQHQRNSLDELRKNTPADGVVAGMCNINGDLFDESRSRAALVHYDYTVLAGTQGSRNHYKQDRMFELAHRFRLPLILFGEGGGGRPGDDHIGPRVAIDTKTFTTYSQLSGLVPMISVVNGRCFAGNTALVACSDVIIATEGSTLGMGGPAMIEGGGLGIYTPEEVGPMSVQVPNGVVDILVKDEFAAIDAVKKYLAYFQGAIPHWEAHDQRKLRFSVPENRLRLYDMREILHALADKDSVLEIRPKFGIGIITAFARFEGRPMGVIANNPHHLAGAIDSDGADKGARFMQLCDAFDIPVLNLIDCPGIMVGPEVERTALVRHCTRLFNVGANMTAPLFTVVVRKAYGLGAQAMLGAGSLVGFFSVAWPTAEFAGMNIEGAVKLGYRKELMAIEDPDARLAEFQRRTAEAYDTAKAVNAVMGGGIDDVIDPAATRQWIVNGLKRLPPLPLRTTKKYPYIDPW